MQFTGSWWFVLLKRKETKEGGVSKFDGMCKSLHNITSNKVPYRVRPRPLLKGVLHGLLLWIFTCTTLKALQLGEIQNNSEHK